MAGLDNDGADNAGVEIDGLEIIRVASKEVVQRFNSSVADPGFSKGETDHGERAAHRERRSGAERGPGAEPLVGVKLKAFCQFLYKKVAKT